MRRSPSHGSWLKPLTAVLLLVAPCAAADDLSFEERVQAQQALERVRYAHQQGARRPFEQAVPRELLEHKVRTYLAESAALETRWNVPVTAVMLERELGRVAARTRMPARLGELFAALDHDSLRIQECLVRPLLVDRLARMQFASDSAIHTEARTRAIELREALLKGELDPAEEHPLRTVIELQPSDDDGPASIDDQVRDEGEAYVVRAVFETSEGHTLVARYAFPTRTWDSWWPEAMAELDTAGVGVVADPSVVIPDLAAGGVDCAETGWEAGVLGVVPDRRHGHTAVWTGSEMIVWGGSGPGGSLKTGWRYDPATDTWAATSRANAPSARTGHAAVWTGEVMVVWGAAASPKGATGNATGGRYDPARDSWEPTSVVNVPLARSSPTAVWTGSHVIFWGGHTQVGTPFCNCCAGGDVLLCNCCQGGDGIGCDCQACEDFVCAMDSFCCNVEWDLFCSEEAAENCTCCSSGCDAGNGGGCSQNGCESAVCDADPFCCSVAWDFTCDGLAAELCTCCGGALQSGGRYDPVNDTWSPTSLADAPPPRDGYTAVWAGTHMIVWGGVGTWATFFNSGGAYDPVMDSWAPVSTAGAPAARADHTAVWTGDEMVIWGGLKPGSYLNTGGRYHFATDTWSPTATSGSPPARTEHKAVWTGDQMIVWGGSSTSGVLGTGGRYDPATNSWLPMSTTGAPAARYHHSMVWTGGEAIVWGGDPNSANGYLEFFNSGGRYDPATNSWTPTFASNAPQGRSGHTAVWTGNDMIIWGGGVASCCDSDQYSPSGGRYDPATDSWTATSLAGAPTSRGLHTAVWTGDAMIVWGGDSGNSQPLATGGRYDPIGNSWAPTAPAGAPGARIGHTAVWSGTRMIVWGGLQNVNYLNNGSRYDPLTNSWASTTAAGAPNARFAHSAVWSGSRMIVWGGNGPSGVLGTGSRYDPVTNSWTPVATAGAPSARAVHTSVWTGSTMVTWGGSAGAGGPLNTGGRYDPTANSWAPTALTDVPSPRYDHTAVWTGSEMIVWGGGGAGGWLNTGGRYDPGLDSWVPTPQNGAPGARTGHTAVWTGDHMLVWGGDDALADGGSYTPQGADLDGDGVGCAVDCDDTDPGAFAAPDEVHGLKFTSKTELLWHSDEESAGAATVYDIVRGLLLELPVGSGASEVCLESDYTSPGPDPDTITLEDEEVPATGEGFWYLVRATNGCGVGTYGSSSADGERNTAACP